MTITQTIIGERLKAMRKHLGLGQKDIAKNIGVNQNVISRLESGKGGNIENLFLLTNFFSGFFYLDRLFSEHFAVMELSNMSEKDMIDSVAVERLNVLKKMVEEEINNVTDLLSR